MKRGGSRISLWKLSWCWAVFLSGLVLAVACGPRRAVSIPSEWKAPPAVQTTPAPKPEETPQAQKPTAIIKPPPAIKESDLTAPETTSPPKPAEKKPSPPPPQRAASMHLVDQAKVALAQGKPDAAIPLLEQAIQVDVYNGDAFFSLARAWRTKGARQKALQFAQKAEILLQDDPPKLKQVYQLEADLCKELGDAAKAESYRQKGLKLK